MTASWAYWPAQFGGDCLVWMAVGKTSCSSLLPEALWQAPCYWTDWDWALSICPESVQIQRSGSRGCCCLCDWVWHQPNCLKLTAYNKTWVALFTLCRCLSVQSKHAGDAHPAPTPPCISLWAQAGTLWVSTNHAQSPDDSNFIIDVHIIKIKIIIIIALLLAGDRSLCCWSSARQSTDTRHAVSRLPTWKQKRYRKRANDTAAKMPASTHKVGRCL